MSGSQQPAGTANKLDTARQTPSTPLSGQHGFMRLVHAVGFTKLYNFILWFILAGAMTGFVLARFQYLNFSIFCPTVAGSNGAAPGECYWFQFPRYKVGIILHLATILPASLLAVLQFTPYIRHHFRTYHRIAGYLAITLGALSTVGVFMIAEKSFGGTASLQAWAGALSIAFLGALGLALYNIRMKQIEQHRAWMIRAWVWAGCIITLRIIMIISAQIVSLYPPSQRLYIAYSCDVLRFIIRNDTALTQRFPACLPVVNGTNTLGEALQVAVQANFAGARQGRPEEVSAVLQACFPMAAWLAWALHVIGTEVYLKLTPRESERLRQISYVKQLENGYKHPGDAGLTVGRLGDAKPWLPDEVASSEGRTRPAPAI